MKKQQYDILLWMIIGWVIISLLYRKATYNIIIPDVHVLGTTDDAIRLVGSKPVSPILNESVTYEFLDTLARLKGADSVDDILMVDFEGMSVNQVSAIMSNINVDELIAYVKSQGYGEPEIDAYEKELILHEGIDRMRKEGTGIDCTKCIWKNNRCVNENNISCTPGVCSPINGEDPWPNMDPWTPTATLENSWGCSGGKATTNKGRCLSYDKEDPTKCVKFERLYQDYVSNTPVLNK